MIYENKLDKGLAFFWMDNNEAVDKETQDSFKLLKSAGILPVIIESGSGDLEQSMRSLMKQNSKLQLEISA